MKFQTRSSRELLSDYVRPGLQMTINLLVRGWKTEILFALAVAVHWLWSYAKKDLMRKQSTLQWQVWMKKPWHTMLPIKGSIGSKVWNGTNSGKSFLSF